MADILILIIAIPLALIVGVFIIITLAIIKSGTSQKERQQRSQETKMMQEIYHGLSKMERRIEALETLLLDRAAPRETATRENER